MSDYGRLLNAGIEVDGPDGITTFHNPVKFAGSILPSIGRGDVYYVDSVNGSASNTGKTPTQALITLDAAVGKCTASQGDVIYLLPGHAEDLVSATALVIDVAGLTIIGLGKGSLRPTFSLTAAAAAKISITAANTWLENILLISNYTGGVTNGISLSATADGSVLKDVEMQETANTKEFLIGIAVAAACSQIQIVGLKYFGLTGGSTTQVIKFAGASDYSVIKDFLIYCDASGAAIDALTAASVWMTIGRGVLHNLDTGAGLSVSVKSDTTGFMHDLRISALKDTVTPAGAAMAISEVYVSNVIFTQGFYQPVQDS